MALDADVDGRIFSNNEFHLEIGRIAGNDYLMPSPTRLLIDHARIGRTFFRNDPAAKEQLDVAADQHDAIIDAIARHDPEECARLSAPTSTCRGGTWRPTPHPKAWTCRRPLTTPTSGATMTDPHDHGRLQEDRGRPDAPDDVCLIGGDSVAARSGRTFETVKPTAPSPQHSCLQAEDVDAAVTAARAAFEGWSKTHPAERKAAIQRPPH